VSKCDPVASALRGALQSPFKQLRPTSSNNPCARLA
jgi:hypothetical protein